jgi:hypothetical protein
MFSGHLFHLLDKSLGVLGLDLHINFWYALAGF